ncbi:MAG: transporter [Nitrospinales bacterium]
MFKPKFLLSSLIVLMFCGGPVFAAPINSDVGLTPFKGQVIVRTQARFVRKADDPSGRNRKLDVFTLPVVGVYGITSRAAVLVKAPYINKDLRTAGGSTRSNQGVGDTTLLGKYRFYTLDYKGTTSRFSVIGGLELPTGDNEERDSAGVLPAPLQLGSGSVDFIAGGLYTFGSLSQEVDINVVYKFNREANDFDFGDKFNYNFAYQRRFWPWTFPDEGLYTQWNAVLELNGVYTRRNAAGGSTVEASGGNTLFLSPGIQFVDQQTIFGFSIQVPIVQDLNGNQLESDYQLAFSFRYTF